MTLDYHEATKHHPGRLSASRYGLEWDNRPAEFKRYPGIDARRLPDDADGAGTAALQAIAGAGTDGATLDLPELTRLLRLGAGVHRRRRRFRTYMSAGALYPIELYVATGGLEDLGPGLWHFDPKQVALERLRDHDARAALAHAAAAPELEAAGAVLALSGILWRTAWKYGARGWRHLFWDAGTMLANLLALAASARLPARLHSAFVDDEVAGVLGLHPPLEQPLALLAVGSAEHSTAPPRLEALRSTSAPLSPCERRFPDAEQAWAASKLVTPEEVAPWHAAATPAAGAAVVAPSHEAELSADPLEQVILRRGSARAFTHDAIGASELAAILVRAAAPVPGDLPTTCSTFVIAHAVEELEPGVYGFQPPDDFRRVRRGLFRNETARLCLDQAHGGTAAATIYLTADLDRLVNALGERCYRAAQLDAGIRAGRIALGAYAQRLGATGLTFYDDLVRAFLDTHEEPMLCVAVGVDANAAPHERSAAGFRATRPGTPRPYTTEGETMGLRTPRPLPGRRPMPCGAPGTPLPVPAPRPGCAAG